MEGDAAVDSPPVAPITREDLLRVFALDYDADTAVQLANDLSPSRAGQIWSLDILLGVAALSKHHEGQIRAYLGWTPARMESELLGIRQKRREENDAEKS